MRTSEPQIRRGFTMIEVLAALAILAIGMTVLIRSQTQSLNNVRKVRNYERAVYNTENQLHWTIIDLNQAEAWEDVAAIGPTEEDEGGYVTEVKIEPQEMDRQGENEMVMLRIKATTDWQEGSRRQAFSLETWYFWGDARVE